MAVAGVVPEPTCQISQAREAGPAEVDVADRHRRRQRRVQSGRRHRESRGPLAEESGNAAWQLEQRAVVERDQADRQSEPGEHQALQCGWHRRRWLAEHAGHQQRRHLGLLQSQTLLGGLAALPAGPAAAENREPLLSGPSACRRRVNT